MYESRGLTAVKRAATIAQGGREGRKEERRQRRIEARANGVNARQVDDTLKANSTLYNDVSVDQSVWQQRKRERARVAKDEIPVITQRTTEAMKRAGDEYKNRDDGIRKIYDKQCAVLHASLSDPSLSPAQRALISQEMSNLEQALDQELADALSVSQQSYEATKQRISNQEGAAIEGLKDMTKEARKIAGMDSAEYDSLQDASFRSAAANAYSSKGIAAQRKEEKKKAK